MVSAVFGVIDAYQGYQKFRREKGYKKWAGFAQGVAGAMTTLGGIALLTGAGAPIAGVAFGVATVASGVSMALEIAGDPEKQEQIRQAVRWAGEQVKVAAHKAKEKIQQAGQAVKSFLHKINETMSQGARALGNKLHQAGQAIGSFFRKAGGWLGSLVGGGG